MQSEISIHKLEDYSPAIEFLRNDLMHNYEIVLALEGGIPGVPRDVFVCETDRIQGVMNVDRFSAEWVWVSLDALTEEAARLLLNELPKGEEFNISIHRQWMKPLVRDMFGVEFTGSRFDYTVDQGRFCPVIQHDVREMGKDDEEMLERYRREEGIHPQWLIGFLEAQSTGGKDRMFGVIVDGEMVAQATIDSHIDEIWGVHPYTGKKHRGKGYGKSTMSAGTQAILDMGKVPYFDAGPDNPAAMKLAGRLGFSAYQEVNWAKRCSKR